jgi:hypothetical protein
MKHPLSYKTLIACQIPFQQNVSNNTKIKGLISMRICQTSSYIIFSKNVKKQHGQGFPFSFG